MGLRILSIVETRSGLIKTAALCDAIKRFNGATPEAAIQHVIVHTGQFSSTRGFDLYFNDLELPQPDVFLGVAGEANPFEKAAKISERLADVLMRERPAVVIVSGEAGAGLECALVAKRVKLHCQREGQGSAPAVAHIGAGRRGIEPAAPNKIKRIVVDLLSDYLFTTEEGAEGVLLQEGVAREKIHFAGSLVVDTLLRHRARVADAPILQELQLDNESGVKPFALLALRHLSSPRCKGYLPRLQQAFSWISQRMPVVFPASAAAVQRIQEADLGDYFIDHFQDGPDPWDARVRIRLIPPLGYFDFVGLMAAAKVVLTDSCGVEEECKVLGVPCVALTKAAQPATPGDGANIDPALIVGALIKAIEETFSRPVPPRGWDGRAAARIVEILNRDFGSSAASSAPPIQDESLGV